MAPVTIWATAFNYYDDCWMYALTDGTAVKGRPGDARVPAGLPFTEWTQWGANRVFKARTVPPPDQIPILNRKP